MVSISNHFTRTRSGAGILLSKLITVIIEELPIYEIIFVSSPFPVILRQGNAPRLHNQDYVSHLHNLPHFRLLQFQSSLVALFLISCTCNTSILNIRLFPHFYAHCQTISNDFFDLIFCRNHHQISSYVLIPLLPKPLNLQSTFSSSTNFSRTSQFNRQKRKRKSKKKRQFVTKGTRNRTISAPNP